MSDNTNAERQPATTTRGRGGNRGRGGAPGAPSRNLRPHKCEVKIGPNLVPTGLKYVAEGALKGSFVVLIVGDGVPVQWTFHRPIGACELDPRSWVATQTSEVKFLLENRSSPEVKAWERRKAADKREKVLRAGIGRRIEGGTERWSSADLGLPACKEGVVQYQAAAKAAKRPDSAWLEFAPASVQVAEKAFRAALDNEVEGIAGFDEARPHFETLGGTAGNVRQTAVAHLGHKLYPAALTAEKRRILGLSEDSITGQWSDLVAEDEEVDLQEADN